MKTLITTSAMMLLIAAIAPSTQAGLETSPYLFTEQAATNDGHFEWDELGGVVFAPLAADVAEVGGTASILASDFVQQPFDFPATPIITSTDNLYTGGTLVDFDIPLSGLTTSAANTTVVFQMSVIGSADPSSFLLDGVAPTSFMDRGVAEDVLHNIDEGGVPFDTHYYWAEWQLAAETEYLIEFTHPSTHASFTQFRVDYFNAAEPYSAVSPSAVPEPSAAVVAALAVCGLSAVGLRRRFDGKASRA